jgi:hypothetical protein
MRALINFFKRPTGQFVAIALFLVAVSYTARLVYVDKPREDEAAMARVGKDLIEEMANTLLKQSSVASDRDGFIAGLPTRTEWFPEIMPCAATLAVAAPNAFWAGLGFKAGDKTAYQYRFDRTAGSFVFRARRDRDCDGVFVVHHLNGTIVWPDGILGQVESKNVGE